MREFIYDSFGVGYQGRFFDVMFVRGGTNDVKHHARASRRTTADIVIGQIFDHLEEFTRVLAKRVIFLGGGIPGRGTDMDTFGLTDHDLGGSFSPPRPAVAVDSEVDRGLARLRNRVMDKQAGNVWQTDVGVCYFQLFFPGQGG